MTYLIHDKTHTFVKEILPEYFSEKVKNTSVINHLDTTISDIVTSYLPTAFDTLTRGINTKSVKLKLNQSLLPHTNPKTIDIVETYLDNRETMFHLLDTLIDSDKVIPQLLNCIKEKEWKNPIFNEPNIDLYLLLAVKNGLLTQYEFTSITLFLMAKRESRFHDVVPYFKKNGKVNETAKGLLKESFAFNNKKIVTADSVLSEIEYMKFEEELRKFPSTEHHLYLTPFLNKAPTQIVVAINGLGLNIFGKVNFLNVIPTGFFGSIRVPYSLISAPLGMISALYNVKFGENAVELNPAIGPLPVAELRENGLNGTRVASIDSVLLNELTGLKYPRRADGHDATSVNFYFHDACFHGYLSSSIPHHLRQRFIQFGDFIKENQTDLMRFKDDQSSREFFYRQLAFGCYDLEQPFFRPEYSMHRPKEHMNFLSIFWSSLGFHIFVINNKLHKQNIPYEVAIDSLRCLTQELVKSNKITAQDIEAISLEIKWLRMNITQSYFPEVVAILSNIRRTSIL